MQLLSVTDLSLNAFEKSGTPSIVQIHRGLNFLNSQDPVNGKREALNTCAYVYVCGHVQKSLNFNQNKNKT